MKPKTITKEQRHELVRLYREAGRQMKVLNRIHKAMLKITREDDWWGYTGDALLNHEPHGVDALLRKLGIELRP